MHEYRVIRYDDGRQYHSVRKEHNGVAFGYSLQLFQGGISTHGSVDYHSPTPRYTNQSGDKECMVLGAPCYCDGRTIGSEVAQGLLDEEMADIENYLLSLIFTEFGV